MASSPDGVRDDRECQQCSSAWDPLPVVVPAPLFIILSLIMLFQIWGRLYVLRLYCEGFIARMCITSFTPLLNHLCSTDSISLFSHLMVWFGLSVCMFFDTSDVVELGFLCSPNPAFSEHSVFPT